MKFKYKAIALKRTDHNVIENNKGIYKTIFSLRTSFNSLINLTGYRKKLVILQKNIRGGQILHVIYCIICVTTV